MCGCDFPVGSICGYHRAAILRELLAAKAAEKAGQHAEAMLRRQEAISLYGEKRVSMVEQDLNEGGEEFARTSTRRSFGSVHA